MRSMKRSLMAALALVLALCTQGLPALAQSPSRPAPPQRDARLFPLEDLRAGMKGTARTVFSGTEPEEFGVEVLGVLQGFPGPRQSAIIARLSGDNVARTG